MRYFRELCNRRASEVFKSGDTVVAARYRDAEKELGEMGIGRCKLGEYEKFERALEARKQ